MTNSYAKFQAMASLDPAGVQILFIPFEQIRTSYERFRPGTTPERYEELGDLPIRVASCGDGTFEVIDGFKRLERWRLDGCRVIPVVIEKIGSPSAYKRMLLEANSPPRTTSPLGEGLVVESLITEDQLSPAAVAKLLGHKKEWVIRRLALATELSRLASESVANRTLGPTIAFYLTSLSHSDQDEVLKARGMHDLNARETIVLIQALRVVEPSERRALLDNPLATVRPRAAPTASPRLIELEQQLGQMSRIVQEIGSMTFPADLAPAERRRLEALRLQVNLDVIRLAYELEDRPAPFSTLANKSERRIPNDKSSSTPASVHEAQRPKSEGDRPGRSQGHHRACRPLQASIHCKTGASLTKSCPASTGRGGPLPSRQELPEQAISLSSTHHRTGGKGLKSSPNIAGDPGDGLPGRSHDSRRPCSSPALPIAAGGKKEDPVPF